MANRSIIIGICMFFSLNILGQQNNLVLNLNLDQHLNEVKKIASCYVKEYDDLDDYKIIINIVDDTIQLYVSSYTNKSGVGHLEPFGLYRIDDKKVFLFIKQGIKWKKDNSFDLNKSEVTMDDYPIWLINITSNGLTLKKGVRGLFAPPLPPKGYKAKYKPPVIDSTILRKQ